jgi:hypothetical protein
MTIDDRSTFFGQKSTTVDNLRESSMAGRLADNSGLFGGRSKSKWYKDFIQTTTFPNAVGTRPKKSKAAP